MPVIVKFKCPKCEDEAEIENKLCMPCRYTEYINKYGAKHYPQAEFNEPTNRSNWTS